MTAFSLKMIAIIAMTLDHGAKILGTESLLQIFPSMSLLWANHIITAAQIIGRIAFPMFAFLIAEGAEKTRSMPRYLRRLALFAVISEPVFFFALYSPNLEDFLRSLLQLHLTNVFFTLLLGAASIYAYKLCRQKWQNNGLYIWLPVFGVILLLGGVIRCDYDIAGILLITALYLAREKGQKIVVILIWSVCLYLIGQGGGDLWVWLLSGLYCGFSALSAVFIWQYNGNRGKPMKWFFYIYYPVHILALVCLR